MAGEDYTPESRKSFLEALGTHQVIADTIGVADRRNVANWIPHGFAHLHKNALLKMANDRGVAPHPELYTKRRHNVPKITSDLGRYIHLLALRAGGPDELAKQSGIPLSALSSMCLKKGRLKAKFQYALEYLGVINEIPLPGSWDDIVANSTGGQKKPAGKVVTRGVLKRKPLTLPPEPDM